MKGGRPKRSKRRGCRVNGEARLRELQRPSGRRIRGPVAAHRLDAVMLRTLARIGVSRTFTDLSLATRQAPGAESDSGLAASRALGDRSGDSAAAVERLSGHRGRERRVDATANNSSSEPASRRHSLVNGLFLGPGVLSYEPHQCGMCGGICGTGGYQQQQFELALRWRLYGDYGSVELRPGGPIGSLSDVLRCPS